MKRRPKRDARLWEWMSERIAVRLLRRAWPIGRVARATRLNRDVVSAYRRIIRKSRSPGHLLVGPPPWAIDREAAALKASIGGTIGPGPDVDRD